MTQQEKKDAIIKALYKNHQLDIGVNSSMGINDVVKEDYSSKRLAEAKK